MKRIIILFLLLSCFTNVYSKTLIISDIDDTIKNTWVRNKSHAALYVLREYNSFEGMRELYDYLLKNIQDSSIHYVSNAPVFIIAAEHLEFLRLSKFPSGIAYFRQSTEDLNFKVNTITALIKKEKPDQLILVGDDGEKDTTVYHTIHERYSSQIKVNTFIRVNYNELSPFAEQVNFVTPLEILDELDKSNTLPFNQNFADKIAQQLLMNTNLNGDQPVTLPYWSKCSNVSIHYSNQQLNEFIKRRCQ